MEKKSGASLEIVEKKKMTCEVGWIERVQKMQNVVCM